MESYTSEISFLLVHHVGYMYLDIQFILSVLYLLHNRHDVWIFYKLFNVQAFVFS